MLWLGIDIGTSATKAVLVNEEGKVVSSASVEYSMSTPKPGWAEQEPEQWWQATKKAILELRSRTPDLAEKLKAIGLTGQMHSAVFLDKSFQVIRPAILWCDQRPAEECREIEERLGFERLVELTLNRALTGFTLPKLLWLRNHEPENYAKLAHLLVCKDYIRFKLTGELATEVSDASGTLMFDVRARSWSQELLSELGINPEILPTCYESAEITGTLSKTCADELGLKPDIPVVGGGGDQPAGAVGNGVVEEGPVLISVGTSGVVFACHYKPLIDPKARLHSFCHSAPELWHSMGVMLSAGGSLRWLREVLKRLKSEINYNDMTALAEKAPIGADGLYFLPYLTGERTPHFDPYARGVFFGINLGHSLEHIIRAVLEGVSFGLRDSVEIMREQKIFIQRFYLTGGGAKSDFWAQILADILKAPIFRLEVDEGPSFGSALLAMVGTGRFSSVQEAVKATLKLKDEIQPNPKNSEHYDTLYAKWRSLYPSLKEKFREVF